METINKFWHFSDDARKIISKVVEEIESKEQELLSGQLLISKKLSLEHAYAHGYLAGLRHLMFIIEEERKDDVE